MANLVNPMQGNIPIEKDTLQVDRNTEVFFTKENLNMKEVTKEIEEMK